jgi:mannosyltransferase
MNRNPADQAPGSSTHRSPAAGQPGTALQEGRWRGRVAVSFAAIFLLALALRLMRLDAHSLWIDEAFSVFWSGLPTSFLWGHGRYVEPTPPLYYSALGFWQSVAGSGDFAMRLPSALISAATALVAGGIGSAIFGTSAGLLAAVLYALSPMAHLQGQEVRVYSALVFFEALSMLCFAVWMRAAKERGRPAVSRTSLAGFAGVIASASVAFRLHSTAILFTLACMTALGGASLVLRWLGGRALLWLIVGGVAFLAFSATQLAAMLVQVDATALDWMDPLSPYYLAAFFVENFAGIDAPVHYWGSVVAALLLIAVSFAAWRARRDAVAMVVLVAAPVLFVALLLIVTLLLRPIWLARVGSIVVVPACVLLAHFALQVGDARRRPAVALALLCFLALLVQREVAKGDGRDWRPVAAAAAGDGVCGGPIFLRGGGMGLALVHYQPALRQREMYVVPVSLARPWDAFEILWEELRPTPRIAEEEARARLEEGGGMLVLRAFRTTEEVGLRGWARAHATRAVEDPRLDAMYFCFAPKR